MKSIRSSTALVALLIVMSVPCAGSTPSRWGLTPPHDARSRRADVFVIPYGAGSRNSVLGYARTGGSVRERITGIGAPSGLAFDRKGNLYVSDASQRQIDVFPPGSTVPSATIPVPSPNIPGPITIDGHGHVWVGTAIASGNGNVLEFSGRGRPLRTVACDGVQTYFSLAADRAGDVFIQGNGEQQNFVDEIVAGRATCTAIPPEVGEIGGLAVTNDGALVVADFEYGHALTYAAPQFRKVVARTAFSERGLFEFENTVSLVSDNSAIWTASTSNNVAAVALWAYPHSHGPLVKIDIPSGAIAVAVDY